MASAPSRILLLRTSALGDVVHCLPVLSALRRHLPQARIGWVVEGAMAPILEGHPDLDELIVVRLREWRERPGSRRARTEAGAARRRLRGFGAEVALDLMGNHKAGVLARLSGAPRRIGLARGARREPSSAVWINEPVAAAPLHAVDRALALLDALGLPREPADFGGDKLFRGAGPGTAAGTASTPPPAAGASSRPAPSTPSPGSVPTEPSAPPDPAAPDEAAPYVLVSPGAGWGNKVYPPERWGEVARRLAETTGLATKVAVAPGEEALAEGVAAASRGAATAVPAFGLDPLAALSRGARLVLGGDTGPVHLAHALGVPVLCLLGPTDPARHGPYGAPERSLAVTLPCSFCYRRYGETKACLLELPAARVAERARRLLGSEG